MARDTVQFLDVDVSVLGVNGDSPNVPVMISDSAGLDGVRIESGLKVNDSNIDMIVPKFCQKYSLSYFDQIFLVVDNRFTAIDIGIVKALLPFGNVTMVRSKVDLDLDPE